MKECTFTPKINKVPFQSQISTFREGNIVKLDFFLINNKS